MRPWPQKLLDPADEHARKNPPGPLKPTLRRFSWSRLHGEVITSDLWGLVAHMSGASRDRVEAFIARLEVYASTNTPRGSVEGFSIRALAVTWRCDADELARIYAALEEPEIGWLDQDHVVSFWERNPDQEDPTAAERMRKFRARKKNAQMQSQRRNERETDEGYPQAESVTRNDRNVTTRADQTNRQRAIWENSPSSPAEAPQAVQRDSGESVDDLTPAEAAEVWVSTEGLRLVVERTKALRDVSRVRMRRWREQLGDDVVALRELLSGLAENTGVTEGRFLALVDDELARRKRLSHGPPLPLPATALKGGRKHG